MQPASVPTSPGLQPSNHKGVSDGQETRLPPSRMVVGGGLLPVPRCPPFGRGVLQEAAGTLVSPCDREQQVKVALMWRGINRDGEVVTYTDAAIGQRQKLLADAIGSDRPTPAVLRDQVADLRSDLNAVAWLTGAALREVEAAKSERYKADRDRALARAEGRLNDVFVVLAAGRSAGHPPLT